MYLLNVMVVGKFLVITVHSTPAAVLHLTPCNDI
jgi:hypothetical protein